MPDDKKILDLSWWSVIKAVTVLLGIWLLWLIQDVIVLAFVVVVIVAALAPVVDRWALKIHRTLAVSLIFLLIGLVIALIGAVILPPLISEIQSLALNLPGLFEQLSFLVGSAIDERAALSSQVLDSLAQALKSIGPQLLSTTRGVISGVVGVFTILVLSFYLLLEEHGGRKLVTNLLPMANREKIADLLQKIGLKMGAWLRGQLTLGLLIGVINFIILLLLGIPYALTLAVWAGITELIPYIGPVLGAIPAVIIAFSLAPIKGFIILIAYILIQQLEANFLVPKVMSKAVGLSPVVIIFAILIGAKLAGFLGVVLAVPAAAAISVLVQEWPQLKSKI